MSSQRGFRLGSSRAAIRLYPQILKLCKQPGFLAGGDQAVQQGAFLGWIERVGPVVAWHFMPQHQHQVGGVHVRQGHVHAATVGAAVVDRLLRDITALEVCRDFRRAVAVKLTSVLAEPIGQLQRTGVVADKRQGDSLRLGLVDGMG